MAGVTVFSICITHARNFQMPEDVLTLTTTHMAWPLLITLNKLLIRVRSPVMAREDGEPAHTFSFPGRQAPILIGKVSRRLLPKRSSPVSLSYSLRPYQGRRASQSHGKACHMVWIACIKGTAPQILR